VSEFDARAFREFETAGWDDVAEAYSGSDVVADLTGGVAAALADAVGAGPGRRILDVACGPGAASRAAADRGADVVGTDISEAMVEVATREVPGARFRRAPAEQLPFPAGSFDGVMSGFGLPHFAEPERVFEEVLRVLGHGGRMAFTTWCTPDKVPFFGVVFAAVLEHGSLDVPMPDGPDMFRFAVEEEAVDVLTSIGFTHVGVTEQPLRVRLEESSQAMDLLTSATVRTRALFEAQTTEAKEAIVSAMCDAVEAMRDGDELTVPMPAVLIVAARP